eukprot:scaffold1581_cov342-Prasinococcus_capsulatus_cf.AAC.3
MCGKLQGNAVNEHGRQMRNRVGGHFLCDARLDCSTSQVGLDLLPHQQLDEVVRHGREGAPDAHFL